jgi:hypothetical protein
MNQTAACLIRLNPWRFNRRGPKTDWIKKKFILNRSNSNHRIQATHDPWSLLTRGVEGFEPDHRDRTVIKSLAAPFVPFVLIASTCTVTHRVVKRPKQWRNSAVSLTVSFNKRNRKQFRLINETENRFVNRFVYYEMERNTKFRVFYTEILLTKWKIPFC